MYLEIVQTSLKCPMELNAKAASRFILSEAKVSRQPALSAAQCVAFFAMTLTLPHMLASGCFTLNPVYNWEEVQAASVCRLFLWGVSCQSQKS